MGTALAAQAALARKRAAERTEKASGLFAEALVLQRRLLRQRALLDQAATERRDLKRRLGQALARVEDVLETTAEEASTTARLLIDVELPRDRSCAAVARRLLESHIDGEFNDLARESALLVVTELANNALLHGRGRILLRVAIANGRLRIALRDDGHPKRIAATTPAPGRGGHGLRLVSSLALSWGTDTCPATVWAELPLHLSE